MSAKGVAALKEFGTGVLGTITDPAQRKAAEDALNVLYGLEPVAASFGDGVLAQSELSRRMNELKTQQEQLDSQRAEVERRDGELTEYHTSLTKWYTTNKDALEAARSGKSAAPAPGGKTPPAAPVGVTEERLNEILVNERAGFLGFSRDQSDLLRDHFAKFGEILAIEPLLQHPKVGEIGLKGVYALVNKERLEQWDTKQRTDAEEKIRADERAKVLAAQAQMPYPSPGAVGSGSPLDALSAAGKTDSVVDAATAHYNRLQQERHQRENAGAR